MGVDPNSIDMLKQAAKLGLVDKNITVVGYAAKPCEKPFVMPDTKSLDFTSYVPRFLRRGTSAFLDKILRPVPRVDISKCVGCGRCAESCPQQIITIENKRASIGHKNCISCFCCQEMCPAHAIFVKRKLHF